VYFTPILGGIIADRWIGQRSAVVIGALSMSAGHLAMTVDHSFLLALLLLVIGSGFLKGNIAAQVGSLYPPDEPARRSHGYVIFSTGINIGSIAGPLLCGLLAQFLGWHYGFGIAALFMLLGLATYLHGYRFLPARVERRSLGGDRLTAVQGDVTDRQTVEEVIATAVFQSVAYYQLYNANAVWIEQHVALDVGAFRIPVAWYQAVNSIFCVVGMPLLFWIWRRRRGGRERATWRRSRPEPGSPPQAT
jgi:POT family proton-dependent oligopeptide transporter